MSTIPMMMMTTTTATTAAMRGEEDSHGYHHHLWQRRLEASLANSLQQNLNLQNQSQNQRQTSSKSFTIGHLLDEKSEEKRLKFGVARLLSKEKDDKDTSAAENEYSKVNTQVDQLNVKHREVITEKCTDCYLPQTSTQQQQQAQHQMTHQSSESFSTSSVGLRRFENPYYYLACTPNNGPSPMPYFTNVSSQSQNYVFDFPLASGVYLPPSQHFYRSFNSSKLNGNLSTSQDVGTKVMSRNLDFACKLPTADTHCHPFGKRKRSWSRAVFSALQRKGLEQRFLIHKYIAKPDRKQLAGALGLTDAQVKVWFQNRRMKWRHTEKYREDIRKTSDARNSKSLMNHNEKRSNSENKVREKHETDSNFSVESLMESESMKVSPEENSVDI